MIKVRIKGAYIEASSEKLSLIEKAFSLAIDRFKPAIREVEVTTVDVNGPRGGVDKHCTVRLRLYPRGLSVVRSDGTSLMETVNEACDKVRQVIGKRLSKQKKPARKHSTLLIEEGIN